MLTEEESRKEYRLNIINLWNKICDENPHNDRVGQLFNELPDLIEQLLAKKMEERVILENKWKAKYLEVKNFLYNVFDEETSDLEKLSKIHEFRFKSKYKTN